MATDTLQNLEEGDYVHDEQARRVYEVTAIDAEFSDDGTPSGDVVFSENGETFTRDAQDVDFELHDKQLAIVDPAVVERAETILLEFAQEEIENYLQRLGPNHDYNGIDDVDTLRDIKAAENLHRHQEREQNTPQTTTL